ncbi:PH domain-containing protein [Actinomyces sp. MRS3W]|uniref:PH domain-containing protein n=1 Tax=Actinomyces sp. MRS3W TaxID=2800796 RepID=UPI0028FD79DA|nr:PH domain-containing protein [Actinomyces sp. MRS3W]MDU0348763.1 PH domain-containing protein [Actinomyces sp. MRS3W]
MKTRRFQSPRTQPPQDDVSRTSADRVATRLLRRGKATPPAQDRAIALPTEVEWRRVHPITPLLEGWKGITAVLAIVLWQNVDSVLEAYSAVSRSGVHVSSQLLSGIVAGTLTVLVAIGVALWLSWRMRTYAVDRDAVYLRTGVLNRQLRTARLPRIQSVDVIHPLLGRIFGLGRLRVEVAGGDGSNVTIGFLRSHELEALRDRILDLAAGLELRGNGSEPRDVAESDTEPALPAQLGETEGTGPSRPADSAGYTPEDESPRASAAEDTDADAALFSVPLGFEDAAAAQPIPEGRLQNGEYDLYEVDTRILIGSLLRSGSTLTTTVLLVGFVGLLVAWIATGAFGDGSAAAALTGVLPMMVMPAALGGHLWNRFDKGWRFRAAATPAGIRARFGLTAETSSTLPPGRVHGVQLEQGLLWRGPDWWRVKVSVAGRNAAEVSSSGVADTGVNVLLPVGRRDTALRALWLVMPDLGVVDPDAFLEAALAGRDDDGVGDARLAAGDPGRGFIRISPRGRLFSPLAWRREAIALTETCVVLRLGRWWRRVSVIPYERIQSLRLVQGPFARRRDLAALHLDMVDAEVSRSLSNLDLADAAAIERVISERALRRRQEERLDRWLARATEVGAASQVG